MKKLYFRNEEGIFCVLLLAIVLATNLYPNFMEGLKVFGQGDTYSYREMARFAPHLPDHRVGFLFSQRFFSFYSLGVVSKLFSFPLETVFRIANFAVFFALAFLFYCTVRMLSLPRGWLLMICMLVLCNPYVSRYYLSFHFNINSLLYLCGFVLVCQGFISDRKSSVFAGLAIAALGRQTVLLFLPAVWLWFFLVWWRKDKKFSSLLTIILGSLPVLIIYEIEVMYASQLGPRKEHLELLLNFFRFFQNFSLDKAVVLADFIVRGLIANVWVISFFLAWYILNGRPKLGRKAWLLFFISLSVCIQPIGCGPEYTGNGIVRLCALANPGLALAFAAALQNSRSELSWRFLLPVAVLCLIGSMHHLWSLPGRVMFHAPLQFAILHYMVAAAIVLFYWIIQKPRGLSPENLSLPGRKAGLDQGDQHSWHSN